VGARVFDFAVDEDCLEQLLDRLLGVEADHVVGDLGVAGQLVDDDLVGMSLAQEQERVIMAVTVRQGLGLRSEPRGASCS
jgi:hypothetical protein